MDLARLGGAGRGGRSRSASLEAERGSLQRDRDVELAGLVIVDDDRIDGRYLEVHQGLLSLLVRQVPVSGELRIIVALLHIIRCIERMGDQRVNIAKLVPLSADSALKDQEILDAIEGMGQLARHLCRGGKTAIFPGKKS
jgi:phosphate transport system protein